MSLNIETKITIDGRPPSEFAAALTKYPEHSARALRGVIEYILTDTQGRAIRAAPRLTGDLSRNIGNRGSKGIFKVRVAQSGNRVMVTGEIGTTVPHARIQDKGGTQKPRNAQWLTIPLDAAKTAAGVPRGRARDFEDTFFLKSKKGNLLIVQRKAGGLVPLFVLKKSVTIEGSEYLSSSAEQAFRNADRVVVSALRRALEEATQ